ncbi:chaperone DNAJ protein, putative [Trypanosoma cruzi marinkellei]|uniref:Chaperone DNAJ protein, putative n=1 Tax=Trypanosoma cruzi marinkellei TaxID=85056 RepID=K2NEV2_TRYCR|nr:chaperone DNAJ protein, putative [Trypanosoma cruzi marinkellei]
MIRRTARKTLAEFNSAHVCFICCHNNSRRHGSNKDGYAGSRSRPSSSSCPFAALGISQSSSMETVKEAYRAKCQTEHPDVGGSGTRFLLIKDAYEKCIRRVQEREEMCHGMSSKARVDSAAPEPAEENEEGQSGKYQRQSDAWYESQAKRLREQRKLFYGAFPRAKTSNEMDELFYSALHGHCFDTIDVAEPLVLALSHYHRVTGYGAPHLRSCFNTIDQWEEFTESRAGVTMYHILLQLYTDGPKQGLTPTIIAESVEAIMERMCAKGLEYDDWTLTLAHKAYRISPYPS